jgi:hypothetical protein
MARVPLIPTSELTLDNVPSPDDPKACRAFAMSFDGYGHAGGGPAELMDYLGALPAKDGVWDLEKVTVDDVRADLFMEQRATRWNAQGFAHEAEEWASFERHAVESVRVIRHMLFGEPLPTG